MLTGKQADAKLGQNHYLLTLSAGVRLETYFQQAYKHHVQSIPTKICAPIDNSPSSYSNFYTPLPHLGALRIMPIKHPEMIPAQGRVMIQPM